jgi:hypothetical protein
MTDRLDLVNGLLAGGYSIIDILRKYGLIGTVGTAGAVNSMLMPEGQGQ